MSAAPAAPEKQGARRSGTWWRLLLALPCLAAAAWHLQRQQSAGGFQQVDDLFEDFLIANGRERFEKPAAGGGAAPVAIITLREDDAAEYSTWPPAPLDWRMILEALKDYHPEAVIITSPLNWGRPAPQFVPDLAASLRSFPSIVLGVEAMARDPAAPAGTPPFTGGLESAMPRFTRLYGQADGMPELATLITPPEEMLRPQAELGIILSASDAGAALPYVVRIGGQPFPTLLAQAVSRVTHSPYATQRLRLGPGAGARLSEGVFVPLAAEGRLALPAGDLPKVPEINALDLMTGGLADALSPEGKEQLKAARTLVIGIQPKAAADYPARRHAEAVAFVLSLPRIETLGVRWQWIAWGMAALAGLWIAARARRGRALLWGVLATIFFLGICLLAFQTRLIWCPPTIPAALITTGSLLALLWGRRAVEPSSKNG